MAHIRSVLKEWAWALFMALVVWQGAVAASGSDNPVVVIVSGSMEPAMFRGDMAIIHNTITPVAIDEVIVFRVKDRPIPIIHRVIAKHVNGSMLTKGDNNSVDDRRGRIYSKGQDWVHPDDVIGRVLVRLPMIGYASVLLNENHWFLYGCLTLIAIASFMSNNQMSNNHPPNHPPNLSSSLSA